MKLLFNFNFVFLLLIFLLILFLYIFADIFKPFIFGFLLAYFLDPITDKLEKTLIPRFLIALLLILVTFLFFIFVLIFILPVLFRQFNEFFEILPNIYHWILNFLETNLRNMIGFTIDIDSNMSTFQSNINNNIGFILEHFMSSTISIFNFIMNSFITLFLTFYLLLDWDKLVLFITNLIPRHSKMSITKIVLDIDIVLSKLFRGQLSVCLILSIYYGLSLLIIGLEGGLVIGFFAGLISFIPFVGAIVGGGLAILLGIFQFIENPTFIFLILVIFILGQIVEGNILTPKLVGRSAGINPIWLILSLAFFGKIGGITGLILALPITAVLGVLTRHFLKSYYSSIFYNAKGN